MRRATSRLSFEVILLGELVQRRKHNAKYLGAPLWKKWVNYNHLVIDAFKALFTFGGTIEWATPRLPDKNEKRVGVTGMCTACVKQPPTLAGLEIDGRKPQAANPRHPTSPWSQCPSDWTIVLGADYLVRRHRVTIMFNANRLNPYNCILITTEHATTKRITSVLLVNFCSVV